MNQLLDLTWNEFKEAISLKVMSIQYVSTSSYYWIKAFDSQFEIGTAIQISDPKNDDQIDFETNYKPTANKPQTSKVQTKFELDEIILQLACISGQADNDGNLVMLFEIPGEVGSPSRYIAGGYGFIDNYTWESKILKVEVVDENDIFGFGPGTVLKYYHDEEAGLNNQGWYFWKTFGDEGEVEIEPVGWYGELYAGLFIKITFKINPLAKVKINLHWGTL